jgi:hypothetical protein
VTPFELLKDLIAERLEVWGRSGLLDDVLNLLCDQMSNDAHSHSEVSNVVRDSSQHVVSEFHRYSLVKRGTEITEEKPVI